MHRVQQRLLKTFFFYIQDQSSMAVMFDPFFKTCPGDKGIVVDHEIASIAADVHFDPIFRVALQKFTQGIFSVRNNDHDDTFLLNLKLKSMVRRMNFPLAAQLKFQWETP